jgi:fructokinase
MIYAGVELGGTKCVVILAGGPDDVLARETVPTTAAPDETLGRIEAILRKWQAAHGFDALGIASFGPIDVDPGSARYGHTMATTKPGWTDVDVAPRLQSAAGVPAALDTDVNGAALAELRWGSGRGFNDFAYITVGTGIGVGLIVNGHPTRGFAHSEMGHIRPARRPGDDWPGSCPFHGDCMEGLASGSALRARFGDGLAMLAPDDPIWDSIAWTLGQLCHSIVATAAPWRIAIGGGVVDRQPQLIGMVQASLIASLNGHLRLPAGDYICAPELGSNAGPLGAIALAMTARS